MCILTFDCCTCTYIYLYIKPIFFFFFGYLIVFLCYLLVVFKVLLAHDEYIWLSIILLLFSSWCRHIYENLNLHKMPDIFMVTGYGWLIFQNIFCWLRLWFYIIIAAIVFLIGNGYTLQYYYQTRKQYNIFSLFDNKQLKDRDY